jgi:methyl-accepting chemotaxis protein
MNEQEAGAAQIVQAIEAMRKGSASTVRSLAEQSTAIEQIARETDQLITQFGGLAKAMGEQATASQEITAAASDLDHQTREASRAMKEQTISFKQINGSSINITKQIKLIAAANLENSQSTNVILDRIQDVRGIARENIQAATRIEGLLDGAAALKGRNGRRKPATPPAETRGRP